MGVNRVTREHWIEYLERLRRAGLDTPYLAGCWRCRRTVLVVPLTFGLPDYDPETAWELRDPSPEQRRRIFDFDPGATFARVPAHLALNPAATRDGTTHACNPVFPEKSGRKTG